MMPRLRWQWDGRRYAADLARYRAEVAELVTIYPEELRHPIAQAYEKILDGMGTLRTFEGVDTEKLWAVGDEAIRRVAAKVGEVIGERETK